MTPQALLGHSLGEWVAACVAGVFAVDDAVRLVAQRGALMQRMPRGAMTAVPLAAAAVQAALPATLALAAVNTPAQCVVGGPEPALAAWEQELAARGVVAQRLETSHAFHSPLMAPMVAAWTAAIAAVPRQAPRIPWLSNVTGTWIRAEEATDPAYWGAHVLQPVRFADAVTELLREPARIWLELGPGHTLSACARRHPDATPQHTILTTLESPSAQDEPQALATALAQTWLAGATPAWPAVHHGPRRRVPLPTYPFERQRYWVDPPAPAQPSTRAATSTSTSTTTTAAAADAGARQPLRKDPDASRWFWTHRWEVSPPSAPC